MQLLTSESSSGRDFITINNVKLKIQDEIFLFQPYEAGTSAPGFFYSTGNLNAWLSCGSWNHSYTVCPHWNWNHVFVVVYVPPCVCCVSVIM